MRGLTFLSILTILCVTNANAAPVERGRRTGVTAPATTAQPAQKSTGTVGARAAARTRVVTAPENTKPETSGNGQRVAARAAASQKVVNTGTKINAATQNTVVNQECQDKYFGCMDSFCMLDNTTGGRCICSDKNAEYDKILAEIEKLDQQSYQMATIGVEQLEMGENADAAIKMANDVAQSLTKKPNDSTDGKKMARRALDLSAWDMKFDEDDTENPFATTELEQSAIDNKTGDALQNAVAQLCAAQIPECTGDMQMLKMMYSRRVASDCNAYENSLKQQKVASQQKLNAAEKALRDAALEQYQNSNKYDLGQCTVQFKRCMITTGGCGDDFSKCASIVALDNTNVGTRKSGKSKTYSIVGTTTTIDISASTYDTITSKKPLCMNVTNSCVAVRDKVWDTFLREVAPELKSAELIAEDNARQDCIGNISSCFQKACHDTMDPKDPDGSYDMCLARPGSMLNVCKIPLNNCGISTKSESDAEKSDIWEYVVARLASIRVDSCTKEFKNCLISEDRCGKDYSQCVGLDTEAIVELCPADKLTGCKQKYGSTDISGADAVYDELYNIAQGVMLNIDNSLLTKCQQAADQAMIRVCGDTEDCTNITTDKNIGARAMLYKLCEVDDKTDEATNICYNAVSAIPIDNLGNTFGGTISGLINWDNIAITSTDDGISIGMKTDTKTNTQKNLISASDDLKMLESSINNTIKTIEADTTVQACISGRDIQGVKTRTTRTQTPDARTNAVTGRYPKLTEQIRMIIANAAIKTARDNYSKRYDELQVKMMQDYTELAERIAQKNEDEKREIGRLSCLGLADGNDMDMKTFRLAKKQLRKFKRNTTDPNAENDMLVYAFNVGTTTNENEASQDSKYPGGVLARTRTTTDKYNLKEVTEVNYTWDTMECKKCITKTRCSKKVVGKQQCKTWEEPTTTCTNYKY